MIVQSGNVDGLTVTAGLMMIVYACKPVAPTLSVAVTVKLNVPPSVGVPVNAPLVASDKPVGSAPDVTANVATPVPPVFEIASE